MYNFIKGCVTEINLNFAVLENNGIGYQIYCSLNTLKKLSEGDTAVLYTYLAVREDDMSLYGFYDKSEKQLFLQLMNISGIGAKLAVTILGGISAGELSSAVASGNVGVLNRIKGVGKKTAERIVLELKDKLGANYISVGEGLNNLAADITVSDAVAALISLGYTRQEAEKAVLAVDSQGMTTEQIVFRALKGR